MKQAVSSKSVISAQKLNLIFKTNDGAVHALKDIDLRRRGDLYLLLDHLVVEKQPFLEWLQNLKNPLMVK